MSNEEAEIEIDLLRERLNEYRDLLSVSYSLVFEPHKDIEKRAENLGNFRDRLLEHGIVEESRDDRTRRMD